MKKNKNIFNKIMLGGNLFSYAAKNKEVIKICELALDYGINSIDTANVYSNGKSEKIISNVIRKCRDKWFIASKIGHKSNMQKNNLNNPKKIIKNLDESLIRLKTDYVDLLQLHHYDPTTPAEEIIFCMNNLIKKGKILSYGVSNYNLDNLKQITKHKKCKILTNQVKCNLIYNNAISEFKSLKKKIKLISYSTLHRGLLSNRYLDKNYRSFRYKNSKNIKKDLNVKFYKKIKIINNFSKKYENMTIERLSILYLLKFDFFFKVIVGIRSQDQLKKLFSKKFSNVNNLDFRNLEKKLSF